MQAGFPLALVPLIRCSADGAALVVPGGRDTHLTDGDLECSRCARVYGVRDGILSLLDERAMHPESAIEMRARDERNDAVLHGDRDEWASPFATALEEAPTLEALGPFDGAAVCELGAGAGRYSLAIAARASALVAVDLSRAGLLVLRRKLAPDARVALVQADVTRPFAAAASFGAVLSTLHSNLPGREARAACLREIARITTDEGRAVVSMHHRDLRAILGGVPAVGRYADNGIFRELLHTPASREEASPFFGRLSHRYIAASIPGVRSLALSRAVAQVPGLRSSVSQLFLAIGERPVRVEGGVPCA
jgi:SAM-dependent methyltransferase